MASSSNCVSLNRNPCSDTPQTCGKCLDGFLGISGAANQQCKTASAGGGIGEACAADVDCLYGPCQNKVCSAAYKQCPSLIPGDSCSGHGSCSYTDPSGKKIPRCVETDVNCFVGCVCADGYGGSECGYDPDSLAVRASMRRLMCESLLNTTKQSVPSAELVESMISSLRQSYNPTEVLDDSTRGICSQLLLVISKLGAAGYLSKSQNRGLPQLIAETTSLFISSGDVSSQTSHTADAIDSTTNLQKGMLKSMVGGQIPLTVISSSVRTSAVKQLAREMQNASLAPPQTDAESQYGSPGPRLIMPPSGLQCPGQPPGSYSRISIMQWGKNPYSNASSVQSPLLAFSNTIKKRPGGNKNATVTAKIEPYYIVIQFATPQNITSKTFVPPPCGFQKDGVYKKCPCNESSLSPTAVTYRCFDTAFLCPKFSRPSGRRLSPDFDHLFVDVETEEEMSEREEDMVCKVAAW